ncbi:polysaccharide biosynthesis protein [Sphingopyxis alaskensis]|uniref:Polysaccharide biosynthesis protein CapD n=1 Tax=Sphingopyxis alaskensis (strain DSM 13593 / LMG 18877 / RB2256) TaxID=317655 RepID=Q1GSS4_SPHAL|nr:nucleoside-diphosphate sugar epimerase/dehydratase [Sphingopyxis alaskensis]ABF53298.1 polysaccharide biosynthesis protein CapD [Sphingopyxis alaskensis RB2256]
MFERFFTDASTQMITFAARMLFWPRWGKLLLVLVCDAILGLVASAMAFSIRLGEWSSDDWPVLRFGLTMLLLWFPIAFWRGIYSAIFRYAGRGVLISLAVAVAMMTVPLIVIYMYVGYPGVPRTIAILGPILFLLLMGVARIVGRYVLVDLFHSRDFVGRERNVLIYGAGTTGQRLAASLSSEGGLRVAGFLDDDRDKRGKRIDGARIFHSDDIESVLNQLGVTDIVLAMTQVGDERRKQIIRNLARFSINVQMLPPVRDILEGKISASAIRPIEVEDLLGRPPVAPDRELLSRSVKGKHVMVTGAGGSIGSELCRQILRLAPHSLTLVESSEFSLFRLQNELEAILDRLPDGIRPLLRAKLSNVADAAAVERLFADEAPDTIYHAAAYKHVPLLEENPLDGVANNIRGTRNMAEMAVKKGVGRFILISTDKAVRPPNVMGASKRVCEMLLQDMSRSRKPDGTIFSMVRFGNVLGSSGSVVPTFRQQIERGGPVTVTHRDVTRYFMTIPEAAELVIQAGSMATGGEVFLLDMGEPVRIWDLAETMVRLSGLTIRSSANPGGSIEIVERGLRKGEKLFEELLVGEESQPTAHPRIMQAREECVSHECLYEYLTAIEAAIAAADPRGCRAALKRLVPTLHDQSPATVPAPEHSTR